MDFEQPFSLGHSNAALMETEVWALSSNKKDFDPSQNQIAPSEAEYVVANFWFSHLLYKRMSIVNVLNV